MAELTIYAKKGDEKAKLLVRSEADVGTFGRVVRVRSYYSARKS